MHPVFDPCLGSPLLELQDRRYLAADHQVHAFELGRRQSLDHHVGAFHRRLEAERAEQRPIEGDAVAAPELPARSLVGHRPQGHAHGDRAYPQTSYLFV